jgi:hypothetical protein
VILRSNGSLGRGKPPTAAKGVEKEDDFSLKLAFPAIWLESILLLEQETAWCVEKSMVYRMGNALVMDI